MENEIEYLKDMQKLELKDGDIVVIKSPEALTLNQIELIKQVVNRALDILNIQVRIMVLDSGLDIGVLRKSVE